MKKHLWVIPILLFSIISLIGDLLNAKFDLVDFEVYYRTAERMLAGEPIYRIESDGHFVYKYAPPAALYFIPFLLLGFGLSKYVFWLLITIALIWSFATLVKLFGIHNDEKLVNYILFFAILSMLPHIHLEWHLGQVNLLLMVLFVALVNAQQNNKPWLLGILLGASIFVKPFGLIFLPYLLLRKQFTALLAMFISMIIIGILPFVFYPSLDAFFDLYIAWIKELQIEMASKQSLFADANHTIFSVLARYTPLQYLLTTTVAQKVYQLLVLALMGGAFLKYMQWANKEISSIPCEWFVLTAWIPILAFTSQNAFIYTFPLIVYLLFQYKALPTWATFLLIIGCFLMGINMYDLVGKVWHRQLMDWSIYTVGSILLTVVAFYWRRAEAVIK